MAWGFRVGISNLKKPVEIEVDAVACISAIKCWGWRFRAGGFRLVWGNWLAHQLLLFAGSFSAIMFKFLVSDVGFKVWGSRFMVWDRSGFLRYSVLGIRFFWRSGCEVSFLGIGFGVLPVYFWPERLHETCVFVRHWVAGDILQCYSHVTCNTQKVIRLLGTLHSLLIDFAPRILWWKMLWRWRRRWSSSLWSRWSWWWFCSEWWRWRSLPKWQKFYNTHNIASLAPNSRTCLVTLQRHKCKLQLPAGECANDEWGVMLGIWGFHEWCQCMK